MPPTETSLVVSAREGTGIATLYRALDELVERYTLDDAALVVEVEGLGRQVLRAGRRPLRDDERQLRNAEPGLYLEPALDDVALHQLLERLTVALGTLALRHDVAS